MLMAELWFHHSADMILESKAVFIGEVNRRPSSRRLFVTSHLVDPGFNSFLAPPGSKDASELFKGTYRLRE